MQSIPKNRILKMEPNALNDIRKIYNLNAPGRIEEAVAILKDWIQKQEHFVKKDFNMEYLEISLILNKGSVEKTKRQIDRLCTLKTLMPDFFKCHNVSQLKDLQARGLAVVMPRMTADFYRIFLVKLESKLLTDKTVMEYCQYVNNLIEYMKFHDYTNGYILIYDLREANISDVITKMNPVMMQHYMRIVTEGYATRIKAIHVLTSSTSIDVLVKIFKQILSKKLGDRISVHKTIEELQKVIPSEILPQDYNGKEKSLKEFEKDWIEELSSKDHVNYMKMMNKACTDERLRCTDKFNEECMGMPGSFRNLTVD